jgi:outer membrane protein assembly factor BamB
VSAYPIVGDTPVWTTRLPGDVTSQPQFAHADGLLIVRLWTTTLKGQGFLYTLDAETGRAVWRFPTGGEGARGPVVANGVVYVAGSANPKIFGLDLKSGSELWSAELHAAPTADPIVAYGFLFVPVGGTIYVFGT